MKKIIIIPNCSDLNRGDQALVWETKRIAEEAGYKGKFYVTVEDNEPIEQSVKYGLLPLTMLLKHPSRVFTKNDNIIYSKTLKLKWGIIAMFDLIESLLLLNKFCLKIAYPLMSAKKRRTINLFREADALFVKGGGFVHYYGGMTSLYYAYFSLFHIFFAAQYKKKIYFMPNSMGPYEGPFVKWVVRKALKKCTFVIVRETFSQKMAEKELGLRFPCYPDLAFYLPNSSLTKNEIIKKYNIPQDRKIVAMTMRPHRFPQSQTPKEDYLRYKKELARFIEWIYGEGYLPMPIDHTLAFNSNENDAICIQEVLSMVRNGHYFYFSDKTLNCQELKSIYSICDYVIGTRFHSVIFSLANKIPGIAITYTGNKAQGIMNDFGLKEYVISIDDVTCELLQEKFKRLVYDSYSNKKKIQKYLDYTVEVRNELINKIQESR